VEKEVEQVLRVVPEFLSMPFNRIWSSYDREADVLYVNFKKPSHADNSGLTNDDIVVRYVKGKVIGVTVFHARKPPSLFVGMNCLDLNILRIRAKNEKEL